MKLNLKLKTLAAAVALMAANQGANASLLSFDDRTGNSSFLFFAFDSTPGSERSFIEGLGTRLDDIVAAPHATQTFNLPGLNSFFAGSLNPVWGVVAADNVGSGFSNFRAVTSETAASGKPAPTASQVRAGALSFDLFTQQADKGFAAGTPVTTTATADNAYAGSSIWGNNWGGQLPNASSPLTNGSTLVAWLLDNATINLQHKSPNVTQLDTWKLNLTGNQLVYAPAAVPIPAAMWMLGSGLMGLVGVSRRRASAT